MVAEQVRRAIESAERAAEELRTQARERASSDREAVHRTAAEVLGHIEVIEGRVGRLLRELRAEVHQIVEQADRPPDPDVDDPAAPDSDEDAPTDDEQTTLPAARERRRGPFARRGRMPPARPCAVCGRTSEGERDDGRRRTAELSLCAECEDEGWQLPAGATVPYRPSRDRHSD
jgi:hypothetical protein